MASSHREPHMVLDRSHTWWSH